MEDDLVVLFIIDKKCHVVKRISIALNGDRTGCCLTKQVNEKLRISFLAVFPSYLAGIVTQGGIDLLIVRLQFNKKPMPEFFFIRREILASITCCKTGCCAI